MKILFLSRWYPYPPNNGSKLRIFNLLNGLAKHYEITLISFYEPTDIVNKKNPLYTICRQVYTVLWKPFNPHTIRSLVGYFQTTPRSIVDTFSGEMAHRIKDVIGTEQIDFVIACEYIMGSYSDYFRNCSAILDDLELGYFYPANDHSNLDWINIRKGLTWIKHRNYISHLLDKFHACTVVSNPEKQLFEKNISNSKHVWVVPNCVNLSDYQDDRLNTVALRNTMIFTGSFGYRPNYEAMIWFIEKVYPLVQSEIPDVHLMITGDHAGKPLPVANNITFTGYVDNIRPLIAQSWISLAPIWTGGGTRLKILEAMALGTPVVSTSKGAEGLDVLHGHDILIDDTSEGFAKSVIRLLQDPDLRSKLTINAYQLVSQKYDWQVEIPEYIRLIQSVLVS